MKRGCVGDLSSMQANLDEYSKQQAAVQTANAKAESTVYTY